MKRKLLFTSLLVLVVLYHVKAQAPASATWALGSSTSSSVVDPNSAITASNQILGAGITDPVSNISLDNGASLDWQKLPNQLPQGFSATFYTEYKVTVASGKYFQVNNISMRIFSGGGGNYLVAAYSLDNFLNSNPIAVSPNLATYNYQENTPPATPTVVTSSLSQADPLVMFNGSTTTVYGDRTILTFPNLNINVDPGQTLSIRVYSYRPSSQGATTRYTASKDVVISGRSNTAPIPLPLDFLSFNVSKNKDFDNTVSLNWSTTNEVNTHKFVVERYNKNEFQAIGEVLSNNKSGINYYNFRDNNPVSGTSYYRLKQLDLNGDFKYSAIKELKSEASNSLAAYPIPAKDNINITHTKATQNASIHILDIIGRKLGSFKVVEGSTTTPINLSSIDAGHLLLVYNDGNEKSSLKIIKE